MNNHIRYLKLTDYENQGTIIKQQGRKFYGVKDGEWKQRGLSLGYFLPESPEYECYEEITEEQANKLATIN